MPSTFTYSGTGGGTTDSHAPIVVFDVTKGFDGSIVGGSATIVPKLLNVEHYTTTSGSLVSGNAIATYLPIHLQPLPAQDFEKVQVAAVLSKQIPEFIREDDPDFVAFLQAYYSFMEQPDPQPMTVIRNLTNFRDIDKTLDDFVTFLRDEFIPKFPQTTFSDQRFFLKKIVSLYQAKATIKSFKTLFLLLFNKNVEIFLPWTHVLKVSDGKWILNYIMKVTPGIGNILELIGQEITQGTSHAIVETIEFLQDQNVYLITVNFTTLQGTFLDNQDISGISNVNGSPITAHVQTIVTQICASSPGSYHYIGEPIQFTNLNTGFGVRAYVSAVKFGGIDTVFIDQPGTGYEEGEQITVNNNGTKGALAAAQISEVILDSIILEDFSGPGCNSGYLLEEGPGYDHMPLEEAETGGIKAVEITNPGFGYDLPPILIPPTGNGFIDLEDGTGIVLTEVGDFLVTEDSSTGSGAAIYAGGHDIGRISKIAFIDNGIGFTDAPRAYTQVRAIIGDISGSFNIQEPLTVDLSLLETEDGFPCYIELETGDRILNEFQDGVGVQGQFHILDADRNIVSIDNLILPPGFVFETDTTIRGSQTNSTFRILDLNNSDLNFSDLILEDNSGFILTEDGLKIRLEQSDCGVVIDGLAQQSGFFLNDDGKISDSLMIIQDDFYWQKFSYVIQSD